MQLRTRNGQLTLGSVFKLFVVGWICAWTVFAGFILLLLVLIALISGQMLINGEMVHGRGVVLAAMAPILVFFPVVIAIQAFMFGGFLTGGVWLYRLRRPLQVLPEKTET